MARCVPQLSACALLTLLAPARAQLLPNCLPREILPYDLQGFGYLRESAGPGVIADLIGNYSLMGNGVEHYGPSFFNLGGVGGAVSTGVLTTICVASATKEPTTGFYALTFAREEVNPIAAMCGILDFTLEPRSSTMYDIHVDYHVMVDGFPKCESNGKAPSKYTVTGYDHDGTFIGRCPGPTNIVPPILSIQPYYEDTLNVEDLVIDMRSHFSPSAWVDEYLEGAAIVQSCILGVEAFDPGVSGLPGAVALWQVIYGEPASGTPSGCGWYAQVGALTATETADLSFAVNFIGEAGVTSLTCPTTLAGNVNLVNFTGYFTTVVDSFSPTASVSPTSSATPTATLPPTSSNASNSTTIIIVAASAGTVVLILILIGVWRYRSFAAQKPLFPDSELSAVLLEKETQHDDVSSNSLRVN